MPSEFCAAEAMSVNGSGHVAGVAKDGSRYRALHYRNGKVVLLPGNQSKPFAIDDFDQVVGESVFPKRAGTGPVLWKGQTVIDRGACCGGTARGINNQGQIVGDIYDERA
jgi:uncharacterized membrane protein